MNSKLQLLILSAILISFNKVLSGQIAGSCSEIIQGAVPNLEMIIGGQWYAIETSQEIPENCLAVNFEPVPSLDRLAFNLSSSFYFKGKTHSSSLVIQHVYSKSAQKTGAFFVLFNTRYPAYDTEVDQSEDGNHQFSHSENTNQIIFHVVHLDDLFLVVKTCEQKSVTNADEEMWIFSREQIPDPIRLQLLKFSKNGFGNIDLKEFDRDSCPRAEPNLPTNQKVMSDNFRLLTNLIGRQDSFDDSRAYLKYISCLQSATSQVQIDLCINYYNLGVFK
ncbi:uncharacterized protein LOC142338547 [Convolutriloba macropyga]|uniref:uncharacterized protein LOC142338547 n=1 Tax=Convolutriloba macropyga TaxID=536237 RepID=UPI003F5216FC